jgi:hypothetical protein
MPDPNEAAGTPGDPLDAVIAAYVQQIEAGQVPDREALLAAHPELAAHPHPERAERLRAFFADFDRLFADSVTCRVPLSPAPRRASRPGSCRTGWRLGVACAFDR